MENFKTMEKIVRIQYIRELVGIMTVTRINLVLEGVSISGHLQVEW